MHGHIIMFHSGSTPAPAQSPSLGHPRCSLRPLRAGPSLCPGLVQGGARPREARLRPHCLRGVRRRSADVQAGRWQLGVPQALHILVPSLLRWQPTPPGRTGCRNCPAGGAGGRRTPQIRARDRLAPPGRTGGRNIPPGGTQGSAGRHWWAFRQRQQRGAHQARGSSCISGRWFHTGQRVTPA